ncbi:ferredoxin--nitrite reductase, chloroplastic-like, partial [Phalaenopsis equestris]|uniref:ferredoxin--nitrite reductase, chloroplastic-like n=1 Tax=Phalaenopsis equestris TaxID=78828 RepID=UPI0009E54EDE
MDNVRNPVGNPLAGIDPFEILDTRPYTSLLSSFVTSNSKGNLSLTNLPRKWNVCVVGSHDLYEHPHINDLAYIPAEKNGSVGFNLLVGGFFSPKRCAEAVPLDAWIPADDVVPLCKAVLESYRDLGSRGNRQKTRMMWLIDELGIETFRSEVEKRMPMGELERASPEELVMRQWERRDYLGVHPQKQPGLSFVGLHVPVGRVQAEDMFDLARIADAYGSGELRLTVEQNVIIPNVENSKLSALLGEPLLK